MRWSCAARAMNSFSYLRKNQKKKTPTLVLKKKTYGQDLVVLSCFRSFELAEFLDYRIEGPHDSNCSLTVNRPSQFPLQETGGIKRRQFAVNCTICTALSKCHVSTWAGLESNPESVGIELRFLLFSVSLFLAFLVQSFSVVFRDSASWFREAERTYMCPSSRASRGNRAVNRERFPDVPGSSTVQILQMYGFRWSAWRGETSRAPSWRGCHLGFTFWRKRSYSLWDGAHSFLWVQRAKAKH